MCQNRTNVLFFHSFSTDSCQKNSKIGKIETLKEKTLAREARLPPPLGGKGAATAARTETPPEAPMKRGEWLRQGGGGGGCPTVSDALQISKKIGFSPKISKKIGSKSHGCGCAYAFTTRYFLNCF